MQSGSMAWWEESGFRVTCPGYKSSPLAPQPGAFGKTYHLSGR